LAQASALLAPQARAGSKPRPRLLDLVHSLGIKIRPEQLPLPIGLLAEIEHAFADHLAELIAHTQLAAGLPLVLVARQAPNGAGGAGLLVLPSLLLPFGFGQQGFVDAGLEQGLVGSVEAGEGVVPHDLEIASGIRAQAGGGDQDQSGKFGFDDVTFGRKSGPMAANATKDSGKPH